MGKCGATGICIHCWSKHKMVWPLWKNIWLFLYFFIDYYYFWDILLHHPGWSVVVRSQLSATSASLVAGTTCVCQHCSANFCMFSRDRVSLCWPGCCWTPDLRWSTRLGFPKCWDYSHEPLRSACFSFRSSIRVVYLLRVILHKYVCLFFKVCLLAYFLSIMNEANWR